MAFWLLRRPETGWQTYRAMLIRAPSVKEARKLAQDLETGDASSIGEPSDWMDPTFTTCMEIQVEGKTDIIIADFKEG